MLIEEKAQSFIGKTFDQASEALDKYFSTFGSFKEWIVGRFGENGLVAVYIILAVLAIVIVSRLVRITFDTVKYLLVAVALAFIGSWFLPYSFFMLLPVTATACSLMLLFKG
jgi:hypothetical protein